MDIKTRVINYYKSNQFVQKFLKGIDTNTNEVLLEFNGVQKKVSIDTLESFKTELDIINYINGKVVSEPVQQIETLTADSVVTPNPSIPIVNAEIVPEPKEQILLTEKEDLSRESLNDIKILTELKNKEGLNNLIKKFAVNPSTGLIDINQAISKVTKNTIDEVVRAIRNNYEFDTNMSNYDIDGKYVGNPFIGGSTEDEKIQAAFNNVKVYIDASKMYSEQANYNDAQIANFVKKFTDKIKEELHGSVSVPVNQSGPVVNEINNKPLEEPTTSSSAGFADIFVLTVIVLVYAVIIVNLVLKLK